MSSKARGLADLGNAFDDGALSNRNLIINGAMQVAQRGNRSPSGFSGSFYAGPDRWLVNRSGTGTTGFSQISSTDFGGLYAAEATFLAAAGETYIVTQRIEGDTIGHLAGETVTLSFWVKGSNTAGGADLNASLSYATAKDNFTSETVIGTPQSISYTASAQYVTMTVTLPSGATNGVGVRLAGTKTTATGTFTLTFGGVQLEASDTATPFEHRSYDQEHLLCQRYFQRFGAGVTSGRMGVGGWNNNTSADISVFLTHEMRVSPTVTAPSKGRVLDLAVAWHDVSSFVTSESMTKYVNIGATISGTSGAAQGDVAVLGGGGAAFDYLMDAEL